MAGSNSVARRGARPERIGRLRRAGSHALALILAGVTLCPGAVAQRDRPAPTDVEGWVANVESVVAAIEALAAGETDASATARLLDLVRTAGAWPDEVLVGASARSFVNAVGTLFANDPRIGETDDASRLLARAAARADADRACDDLYVWFQAIRVAHLANHEGPPAVVAVVDGIRARIAVLRQSDHNPETAGYLGRMLVDACCDEWRIEPARSVVTDLQTMRAAAEGLGDRDYAARLALHEQGCVARISIQSGRPEFALPTIDATLARLDTLMGDAAANDAGATSDLVALRENILLDKVACLFALGMFGQAWRETEAMLGQVSENADRSIRLLHALAAVFSDEPGLEERGIVALRDIAADPIAHPADRLRAKLELHARARLDVDDGDFAVDPSRGLRSRMLFAGVQLRRCLDSSPTHTKSSADVRAELASCFEEFKARIAAIPPSMDGIGFFHFDVAQQLLADLVEAELAANNTLAGRRLAFARVLEAQALGSLHRSISSTSILDPDIVQRRLAPGAGILVYVPSRFGSFLFVVDAEAIDVHRLPDSERLLRLAESFVARVSTRPEDPQLLKRSRALTDALLPTGCRERVARWSHMLIAGNAALANLPFEALSWGDGALLGERAAVCQLASVPLALALADRSSTKLPAAAAARRDRIAFVSTLQPTCRDAQLGLPRDHHDELTANEIEELLASFGHREVRVGPDATIRAVGALQLDDFDVFHIFAHGGFDPRPEVTSGGAVLALRAGSDTGASKDDGLLRPSDLLHRSFRGVVILSACSAAREPKRSGEDHVAGFAGSLLKAGAESVVQSRAILQQGRTLTVVGALHRRIAAGENVAEALRRVRASLPRTDLALRFSAATIQVFGPLPAIPQSPR